MCASRPTELHIDLFAMIGNLSLSLHWRVVSRKVKKCDLEVEKVTLAFVRRLDRLALPLLCMYSD